MESPRFYSSFLTLYIITVYILYINTVKRIEKMFVELVYDKRNVEGLANARSIILNEGAQNFS